MPFFLNSLSCSKNYPRNINYIPAVIFFRIPRFEKKLLFSDSLLGYHFFWCPNFSFNLLSTTVGTRPLTSPPKLAASFMIVELV